MQTLVQNKNHPTSNPNIPIPALAAVHSGTMGRLAVLSHHQDQYMEATRESSPDIDDYLEDHPRQSLRDTLKPIRNRLNHLKPEQRQTLDNYMTKTAPSFIKGVKEQEEAANYEWAGWLGLLADDEQLMNFLQWHVHSLESQQNSSDMKAELSLQRERYQDGLVRGAQQGWLHPEGARMASQKIMKTKTYLGDVFDTLMQERGGYHFPGSSEIVISNFTENEELNLKESASAAIEHAYTHEVNHAALGFLGATWMDEALTEHIALAIKHGEPYHLRPGVRTVKGGYQERRSLLTHFLLGPEDRSAKPGSLKAVRTATRSRKALQLAMLAYSAPEDSKGAIMQEFVSLTNKIWGVKDTDEWSALARLSLTVAALQDDQEQAGRTPMAAQAYAAKAAQAMLLYASHDILVTDTPGVLDEKWKLSKKAISS